METERCADYIKSSEAKRKKRPAVFLDRDGVLCKEKGYVSNVNQIEIFDYARECVNKIKEKGYYAIVITNQSGVARGLFTEEDLIIMNRYLKDESGVDEIYYCPHYPEGKIRRYKIKCDCRKPGTGLLKRAEADFCIDMKASYMVGDRASDILTGQNAGIKTILLESGYGTKRLEAGVTPDYVMENLKDIIKVL